MKNWFIEETLPDGGYRVIHQDLEVTQALDLLSSATSENRLEVWSRTHAESSKGFYPVAYRDHGRVFISGTLKMLMGA